MRFLSRRTCRTALAVVLLLATQLAFAGELCATVLAGSAPDGDEMAIVANVGNTSAAAAARMACCDGMAMPVSTCVTAFGGIGQAALATSGASLPDIVSLVRHRSSLADNASATAVVLATSAGPPLPAYILLHRFLS